MCSSDLNNIPIRLIGIKQNLQKNGKAVDFLKNKLKGQQVFLRYDNCKYDKDNNLLCYLYLKNKTFINAHLLKNKMAAVDTTIEFRHKNRFLEYAGEQNG